MPLTHDAPREAVEAYGSTTIIATCPGGQAFELERVGWNYDRIRAYVATLGEPADEYSQPCHIDGCPAERAYYSKADGFWYCGYHMPRPGAPGGFLPGDKVIWRHEPRGGYGYVTPVDGEVLRASVSRVLIRVKLARDGEPVERWVRPGNIFKR